MQSIRTNWLAGRDLLFCGSTAALFLLLTSTCSPLYAFNDWVDANSFLTVGKGMMQGLVPYRDLFEQKGPLLFLLHGLACLVDKTGFSGVFIFEVISMTIVLFLARKIVRLFLPQVYVWFIIPVFACLTLISPSFENGDSAEEFCLPLIMGMLFLLARHFKENPTRPLPGGQALLAGILAGCVFMIKYTMLGYWIGFAIALAVSCLFQRKYRELAWHIAFFLIGLLLAIIPWLVYFLLNNALNDFLFTYVYVNFKFYSLDISFLERIGLISWTVLSSIASNLIAGLTTIYGLIAFTGSTRFFKGGGRLALPLCAAFLTIATYFGGREINYYFLAFFPLLIFGLVAAAARLEERKKPSLRKSGLAAGLISLFLLLLLIIGFSTNIPLIKNKKADYPQYKFAAFINRTPDATLLNYGFLDGGFYTAAGITPHFKFFMLNNISHEQWPEIQDEQNRYIREKLVTFVILRLDPGQDASQTTVPYLLDHYNLVSEAEFPYMSNSGLVFKYALYQLK